MKQLLTLIAVMVCALTAAAGTYTVESLPNVHRTDRTQFVANPDGILSPGAVDIINARLANVRTDLSVEPMVVIVDNIEPDDATAFATELFEHWGLGKDDKDNGLLILVARDSRQVTIRPGYGLEGVLPDITCARIIRNIIAPAFAEGDYNGGTVAAVNAISDILLDPANRDEILSQEADADHAGSSEDKAFNTYLSVAAIVAVVMLLFLLAALFGMRGRSDYDKYVRFNSWKPIYLALTFIGLFIPLIASVPLLLLLSHWRNHRRNCPNCGTAMQKVDEVNDNSYLTPSQDLEEQVGSVDYDVWLCPNCGETDILSYVNNSSPMIECDNCHARTARLRVNRVLVKPTSSTKGRGVREYECLNCHHHTNRYYDIPVDDSGAASALGAAIILGSMMGGGRSGGFGGGGGTIGGGFGGGSTGGGGATGSW